MPTFSKRHRLAEMLRKCGLLWLLERLRRRGCLLVLNYHRIGSVEGFPLEDGLISATPADFRAQLAHVRRHFDLPGLEAVTRRVEDNFDFRRPTALVTFDDGYRDNYEIALPILKEMGVPAVFFICPRFTTNSPLPFWDRITYVFKTTRAGALALEYPFPFRVSLREPTPAAAATRFLVALGSHRPGFDEERLFAHLEERAGVEVPVETLRQRLFMSWDEVRGLAAAGMSIGSHSLTHPILSYLPEAELRHEMVESKKVLERELACPIQTIAYPFGSPHAYNDLTRRLAEEAGYRLGFSLTGGINTPRQRDRFDVRRLAIDHDVSLPLFRTRAALNCAFGRSFV